MRKRCTERSGYFLFFLLIEGIHRHLHQNALASEHGGGIAPPFAAAIAELRVQDEGFQARVRHHVALRLHPDGLRHHPARRLRVARATQRHGAEQGGPEYDHRLRLALPALPGYVCRAGVTGIALLMPVMSRLWLYRSLLGVFILVFSLCILVTPLVLALRTADTLVAPPLPVNARSSSRCWWRTTSF